MNIIQYTLVSAFALLLYALDDAAEKLSAFTFYPLPCNGVLCSWHLRYVHVTCLHCRARRLALGKTKNPPYWLSYTYRSFYRVFYTRSYVYGRVKDNGVWRGGTLYTSKTPFRVEEYESLRIDPRGRFLHFRVSAIKVLDAVMLKLRFKQNWGLAEICEFLANYP